MCIYSQHEAPKYYYKIYKNTNELCYMVPPPCPHLFHILIMVSSIEKDFFDIKSIQMIEDLLRMIISTVLERNVRHLMFLGIIRCYWLSTHHASAQWPRALDTGLICPLLFHMGTGMCSMRLDLSLGHWSCHCCLRDSAIESLTEFCFPSAGHSHADHDFAVSVLFLGSCVSSGRAVVLGLLWQAAVTSSCSENWNQNHVCCFLDTSYSILKFPSCHHRSCNLVVRSSGSGIWTSALQLASGMLLSTYTCISSSF